MLDSQSADIDGHSDQHPAGPKEAAQAFLWAVWAEPGARTDERFIFIHMRHDHHPLPKQNKKSTRIPCSTSPQQKHTSQMIKYSNTHTHTFNFHYSLARMIWNVFSLEVRLIFS